MSAVVLSAQKRPVAVAAMHLGAPQTSASRAIGARTLHTLRWESAWTRFVPQGSNKVLIPGTGHFPQLERPTEVNATIVEFLRRR